MAQNPTFNQLSLVIQSRLVVHVMDVCNVHYTTNIFKWKP